MRYKITLQHVDSHMLPTGETTYSIIDDLSLKQARTILLVMFNNDYKKSYKNWGLARIHHPDNTSSYKDGTQSYVHGNFITKIDIDND